MVEAIVDADPSRSPAERAAKILGGAKATKTSNGWITLCPAHDDHHPSLSLANKDDGGLLAHCHAGCAQEQVIEALRSRGIESAGRTRRRRTELPYNYYDEDGTLLYQNVRIENRDSNGRKLPKTFKQRRPDPDHPGEWLNDLKGLRRVPYGLTDLIARPGDDIHCAEGEKDAETLAKLGLCAVSIAHPKIDLRAFRDRRVYVHEDNDKAGRAKARALAQALQEIAASVCVVSYPEAGPGGDVTDWLAQDASRGLVEILALCSKAPKWTPEGSHNALSIQPALSGTAAAQCDTPSPTECDLADRFAEEHSGNLRYCAAWSKWLRFDGQVWRIESTHLARSLAKQLCHREAKNRSGAEACRIASARCVAAVLTLAQADRRLAATSDQWDGDAWLLNTPGGIVDLHTGLKREHQPDAHMTKITGTPPGGHCPLWLKFLHRIFGGDAELIAYMKRVGGYLLTGSTREHALFFGHGPGGNGKSVFLETVSNVLGDYATTAPIEAFTMGREIATRPNWRCFAGRVLLRQ
jgi:putative DNA primase/helicase